MYFVHFVYFVCFEKITGPREGRDRQRLACCWCGCCCRCCWWCWCLAWADCGARLICACAQLMMCRSLLFPRYFSCLKLEVFRVSCVCSFRCEALHLVWMSPHPTPQSWHCSCRRLHHKLPKPLRRHHFWSPLAGFVLWLLCCPFQRSFELV